ncbi:hypothetical protein [Neobacillus mesonae]|uniref:hypothetical protein n=1 Tax=Neobacillus mesonae TaxID=1193713 RepID=UPI00257394CC|nr:hypothetical protein [Neobacillus mesonae]
MAYNWLTEGSSYHFLSLSLMEFEPRKNEYIILKFNRKCTVPITIFLRALAAVDDGMDSSPLNDGSDEELMFF